MPTVGQSSRNDDPNMRTGQEHTLSLQPKQNACTIEGFKDLADKKSDTLHGGRGVFPNIATKRFGEPKALYPAYDSMQGRCSVHG